MYLIYSILTLFMMSNTNASLLRVFPPVTSTSVVISLQNISTFSFNHLVTMV